MGDRRIPGSPDDQRQPEGEDGSAVSGLADLGGALGRLEQVDIWALATKRSLRDLAAGPAGELISSAFRVRPRQLRAIETVERLLTAGEAIVKRTRRLDSLTIESIADEAGVTPQAAYRYFSDVDDLVSLAVRRVQAVEHERLLAFMTVEVFDVEGDLANAAVAFVIRAFQQMAEIPVPMRHRIARDYHDICYDALWRVAEAICAAMVERGDPCAGIDATQLAAGLTAVVAVTKSLFLRDVGLLRQPGVQTMLVAILLGALRECRIFAPIQPEARLQGPAENDPSCPAGGPYRADGRGEVQALPTTIAPPAKTEFLNILYVY